MHPKMHERMNEKMVNVIDRRQHALGGQAWNRSEASITTIVWHYTAVARRNRSFITNHERYWNQTLGWRRGGYHYYIDADGKIYQNYNLTTQTNGARNQNGHTVHISVEANSASDYSQAQINSRHDITVWLMKRLSIRSNRVMGHKDLPGQNTSCPGYTASQMNAFRRQLDKGNVGNVHVSTSKPESAPSVKPTGQRLHLPASATSWNIYNTGGPYTSGNQIAKLAPSKFGGLSYDIVGNPVKDVYLIQSSQFGTVAIYAAKSTSATITGSGAGNAAPSPSANVGKVLQLPGSVATWNVYNPSGPYTTGNEIHKLTPSAFGGLEYNIVGNPTPNVYLIDTGVKGRVAIYAGPETSAKIIGSRTKEGWVQDKTGWWYQEANGSYPKSGWKKVSGEWYLFNSRGYMLTGWQQTGGKWYFMDNSGHMQTGWTKVGSTWYYMNSSGHMLTGWQKVGKTWYYMNASGAMQTGWNYLNKKWYYLGSNGGMKVGWVKVGTEWYYLDPSGRMLSGLIKVGSKHYFLQRNGVLITDDVVELEANRHGHLN